MLLSKGCAQPGQRRRRQALQQPGAGLRTEVALIVVHRWIFWSLLVRGGCCAMKKPLFSGFFKKFDEARTGRVRNSSQNRPPVSGFVAAI
ncbi:hypothetical protein [Pseudomonas capsici]|uniref:hypothetical protein n=1 Tax=Pseudomonas capsici TaxID=2810614 RepID=UPI0021F18BEE|nr:hypothetical protein [Pseudomonas capsici]MCV4343030.1 hypothetical protein [Pseudomonas capsici]